MLDKKVVRVMLDKKVVGVMAPPPPPTTDPQRPDPPSPPMGEGEALTRGWGGFDAEIGGGLTPG